MSVHCPDSVPSRPLQSLSPLGSRRGLLKPHTVNHGACCPRCQPVSYLIVPARFVPTESSPRAPRCLRLQTPSRSDMEYSKAASDMCMVREGRFWLLAFACCLLAGPAGAQSGDATPNTRFGLIVGPSEVAAPLRDSAPSFFRGYGQRIGETSDYPMYLILEEKQVPYFFGHDSWVRVAPISDETPGEDYWVYWGRAASTSSGNFSRVTGLDASQRYEMANWYLRLSEDQHDVLRPALEQWKATLSEDQQEIALPALQPWYTTLDDNERDEVTGWYSDWNRFQTDLQASAERWYGKLPKEQQRAIAEWYSSQSEMQQVGLPALQPWYRELGDTRREDVIEWYSGFREDQNEVLPAFQPWFGDLPEEDRATITAWYSSQNNDESLPDEPTWDLSEQGEPQQDKLADWYAILKRHQNDVFPARQSWYEGLADPERDGITNWYSTLNQYESERLPIIQPWYDGLSDEARGQVVDWYFRLSELENETLPARQEWYAVLDDAERQDVARWYTTLSDSESGLFGNLGKYAEK